MQLRSAAGTSRQRLMLPAMFEPHALFSELRALTADVVGVKRVSYGAGESTGLDFVACPSSLMPGPRASLSQRPQHGSGAHCGDHRSDLRFGRAVDQALVGVGRHKYRIPGQGLCPRPCRRNGACKNLDARRWLQGDACVALTEAIAMLRPYVSRSAPSAPGAAAG
jgi:hypothetical protein